MLILAIETSGRYSAVALVDDTRPRSARTFEPPRRAAQWLAPAIAEVLEAGEAQIADVDLVAVNRGPGSFTSLRIGVATAKTLAYALDRPVVGTSTMDVVAAQAARLHPQFRGRLATVVNAERGDLCAALFEVRTGVVARQICLPELVAAKRFGNWATGAMVAGPALDELDIHEFAYQGLIIADRQAWHPTALVVGQLAQSRSLAESVDERWTMTPVYSRPSAPDEKRGT